MYFDEIIEHKNILFLGFESRKNPVSNYNIIIIMFRGRTITDYHLKIGLCVGIRCNAMSYIKTI